MEIRPARRCLKNRGHRFLPDKEGGDEKDPLVTGIWIPVAIEEDVKSQFFMVLSFLSVGLFEESMSSLWISSSFFLVSLSEAHANALTLPFIAPLETQLHQDMIEFLWTAMMKYSNTSFQPFLRHFNGSLQGLKATLKNGSAVSGAVILLRLLGFPLIVKGLCLTLRALAETNSNETVRRESWRILNSEKSSVRQLKGGQEEDSGQEEPKSIQLSRTTKNRELQR